MQSLHYLIAQYQVLTDWYVSTLDGIEDHEGKTIIGDQMNSLEWLAGHLVTGRYRNMVRVGLQVEPYEHLGKFVNQAVPPPNAIAFSPSIPYPAISESITQWRSYAEIFLDRLRVLDTNTLAMPISFILPSGGNTVGDALAFIALHESYHIGQMSIIRKSIGHGAMYLGLRKK